MSDPDPREETVGKTTVSRTWIQPLKARDPGEDHRPATPLELLYDLCFVVAIAFAASRLHHGLAEGHFAEAVVGYLLVFFAIWWAWVNFTWFASAYDNDDVLYRTMVFVQMTGVLVLAAGVPSAFEEGDFTVVTLGYCIMRLAIVVQWLRAAKADPARRGTALRFVTGVLICQLGWLGLLLVPGPWWWIGWFILATAELLVPLWAERRGTTTWHPQHIAERYGLLTLIVLGESVLAATVAIQTAIDSGDISSPQLVRAIVGGLLILFGMWWIYFNEPVHEILKSRREAYQWGYGHYLVFSSIAAVGAGLAVYADFITGHTHLGAGEAGMVVAAPVAVFVMLVWLLHIRPLRRHLVVTAAFFATFALVLAAPLSPWPVLVIGLSLTVLVALLIRVSSRAATVGFELS